MGSLVIKSVEERAFFYGFWCRFPLITYLSLDATLYRICNFVHTLYNWLWTDFHGNEANFLFFLKKKFKMADSKKAHFSKSPILKNFSRKFLRFVLGLVGLNDAKGIDVAQRIWPWGCPTKAQKQPKNAFSVLLGCFWAFVRQPHSHIRWATSMPFSSFNPTNPMVKV